MVDGPRAAPRSFLLRAPSLSRAAQLASTYKVDRMGLYPYVIQAMSRPSWTGVHGSGTAAPFERRL